MRFIRYKTVFFLMILVIACTPTSRMTVLSFFFDGVPVIDTNKSQSIDTLEILVQEALSDSLVTPLALTYFYHQPYQEKNCMACHDKNSVGKLTREEPALCYGCHDDFNTLYEKLHGPVDVGYCSTCHHPHLSKAKNLLLEEGNNLCFPCHLKQEMSEINKHSLNIDESCISCHNPHGHNPDMKTIKAIPLER